MEPVDNWWMEVKNSRQFPLVSNMACAILTCFHGPKVDLSFSIMNLVVTSETNRLSVESFDAVQIVKYELMSEKKSTVQLYKKDYLKDKVDRNLCKNMNSASRNYRAEVLSKKKKSVCDKQSSPRKKLVSKKAAKKLSAKAVKLQRNIHLKKMRSQISKNPSTSESCTQNEAACCTNVTDAQKQTIKCQLSHVNERPVKCKKPVYSVVQGIVRVELMMKASDGRIININKELIKREYAEPTEESFASKQNHELRLKASSYASNVIGTGSYTSNDLEVSWMEAKNCDEITKTGRSIRLKGPFNPLEVSYCGLTNVDRCKCVKIEAIVLILCL
ncbi:hypothetical protein AVEN_247575-1 [Araneus ventricosus]|uniref:HAT C-terminal dimerisation domain-containing protein n=1 Tax=Araneus ventricosus TaxID=182803 RepID=A0A4Y2D7U6_ARAVE|nr:hypothetical protein AVEN_247575-1 [Araneus ventricosus]